MFKYFLGFWIYFFRRGISFLSIICPRSKISRKGRVYRFSKILNSSLGDFSYVGPRSWIINAQVGNFCSIAPDCRIGLASHSIDFLSTSPIFTETKNGTGFSWTNKNFFNPSKPVKVGNDVWIGERVLVLGGINIGNGAVVGAGAVVTKDVPPYAIVAGVPAKIIRYRFSPSQIAAIEKLNWWTWSESTLRKRISEFQVAPPPFDGLDNVFAFLRRSERRVA